MLAFSFVASIGKIHRHRALPDKRFWEVQKGVQKFLDARAAAIPPPQRPPLSMAALPSNEESQDEYGNFDLDLNDPMVVAAFEDVALPHVAIDQHIYQYVEPLTWYLYRAVCQKLKGISDYLDKFCDLLATWVGCVNILTVHSGSKVVSILLLYVNLRWLIGMVYPLLRCSQVGRYIFHLER